MLLAAAVGLHLVCHPPPVHCFTHWSPAWQCTNPCTNQRASGIQGWVLAQAAAQQVLHSARLASGPLSWAAASLRQTLFEVQSLLQALAVGHYFQMMINS